MKILILKLSTILLCVTIFTGCNKDLGLSDKQLLLFQYEYINYAWGYQHSGFYIDNKGNILTYTNPGDWNFSDAGMVITPARILQNLEKCSFSNKSISPGELARYSKHIESIASSKVTAPKNAGADAGSIRFICYRYDEESDIYRGYLIKMDGDFTCENLNFYAKKVSSWMNDIHRDLIGK